MSQRILLKSGIVAAFICSLWFTASLVNSIVPEPYLDEVFHIPQTRAYCNGEWDTWDSKLTTPAGIYLVYSGLHHVFGLACSVSAIRSLNTTLTTLMPLLYCDILRRMRPGRDRALIFEAVTLSLFPVTFFFAFLFYTDVASLFVVLLAYDAALARHYVFSGALGVMSLWFRQTNVLWIAYIAADALVRELPSVINPSLSATTPSNMFHSITSFARAALTSLTTFKLGASYAPTVLSFAAFLVWNGGIVLGDKTNHVAVFHFPQMLYFVAFFALFASPLLVNGPALKGTIRAAVGSAPRTMITVCLCSAMSRAVKHYTIEHPFLLADNRHYPFYVWRKIYKLHPLVPYALTPAYLVAGHLIYRSLARTNTMRLLQALVFTATTVLVLVPTPLIEPRYFIVPFVLLRLHISPPSLTALVVETLFYASINLVTIAAFLFRPFKWPSEPQNWQRFMW